MQSRTSDHMCGYCTDDPPTSNPDTTKERKFVQYLYDLSAQLRTLKEEECSSLIVYGVAFGEQYTHWLTRQQADATATKSRTKRKNIPYKMNAAKVQQLLQLHGPCFITFVLAEHMTHHVARAFPAKNNSTSSNSQEKYFYSNDGLQLLIPIQRNDLPYTNMRRNTKIFKMLGPSYLFGNWVQRVIWQDTKLIAYNVPNTILPNNYYDYFFNAIQMTSMPRNSNNENHVCVSFMGLPYHTNTMGSKYIIPPKPPPPRRRRRKHNVQQYPAARRTVHFMDHCHAIIEVSRKRPTVSDDIRSVQYQCSTYFRQIKVPLPPPAQTSLSNATLDTKPSLQQQQLYHNALDDALIDSAFMVWDLRSERCQNFVATLTCTWLDEIHCYSDRDQVSFPYVFQKMGLQVIPKDKRTNDHFKIQPNLKNMNELPQQQLQNIITPETHHRLFAYKDNPLQPMVHVTKSSCHWYYNNLNDCDFAQNDAPIPFPKQPARKRNQDRSRPLTKLSTPPKKYKIAVIVTGSFHRFIFQSSMERFIQPLSSQGHYVDYFLSLSMKKAPAYRSDQNYMNHQVSDPIFDKYIRQEDNAALLDAAIIKERIETFMQQELQRAGSNLRHLTFQDNYSGMDENANVTERRTRALQMYPDEDPDLRFPLLDIRNAAIMSRTANANRNMLNLFYHIQHIYQHVLAYEMDVRVKYDYVLFLRDDTMWLHNFDFRSLVDGGYPVTTSAKNGSVRTSHNSTGTRATTSTTPSDIELFVPSCDARVPSMHPMEINDHIAIVKRDRADIYGNYFDELFSTDMDKCAQRLDDTLRYGRSIPRVQGISAGDEEAFALRGCNSEMILQYILEQKNVTIQKVGQGKIPFQRMVLVKNPVTFEVQSCFHKYCQSHIDSFINPSGLKKCTTLNWSV